MTRDRAGVLPGRETGSRAVGHAATPEPIPEGKRDPEPLDM
jgi:hypothetical protein